MIRDLIPGDVLLLCGADLHDEHGDCCRFIVSSVIAKLTGSPYTHAMMYLGGGEVVDCDVGRPVERRVLTENEYRFCDVFSVVGATEGDRADAVAFCLSKLGCRYDYTAVLAIGAEKILRRPLKWAWDDPTRWFCSELVAAAYGLLRETGGRVAPGDLAGALIFEGERGVQGGSGHGETGVVA